MPYCLFVVGLVANLLCCLIDFCVFGSFALVIGWLVGWLVVLCFFVGDMWKKTTEEADEGRKMKLNGP